MRLAIHCREWHEGDRRSFSLPATFALQRKIGFARFGLTMGSADSCRKDWRVAICNGRNMAQSRQFSAAIAPPNSGATLSVRLPQLFSISVTISTPHHR
ncbi:MAG: hypothetical protein RR390_17840 [Hafnia sp.]